MRRRGGVGRSEKGKEGGEERTGGDEEGRVEEREREEGAPDCGVVLDELLEARQDDWSRRLVSRRICSSWVAGWC